jgi:hypothetical protein
MKAATDTEIEQVISEVDFKPGKLAEIRPLSLSSFRPTLENRGFHSIFTGAIFPT